MLKESIVVLDFETTGLWWDQGDRITEAAALRVVNGEIVATFETLINSGARIPPHISSFTGITMEMTDAAPPAARAIADLVDFIGGDAVIAHNAGFDQGFLERECELLQVNYASREFICSVKLGRLLFPNMRTHALGALASSLGLAFTPGAHRAGSDAKATVGIFNRLMEIFASRYPFATLTTRKLSRLLQLPAEQAVQELSIAADEIAEIRAA